MIYTIIASNSQSYDLPPKTIDVMEELAKIIKIDDDKKLSIRQKYQKLFEFVNDIIGSDNTAEILGGKSVDEIDVGELELLILKIQDAYNDVITDYRTAKLRESFSSIPADKLAALTEIGKAIKAK